MSKMEVVKGAEKKGSEAKEMSIEELRSKLSNLLESNKKLLEENRKMYEMLQRQNVENVMRRLDYMFAVVNTKQFDGTDFQTKCLGEIEKLLTLPEKEEASE